MVDERRLHGPLRSAHEDVSEEPRRRTCGSSLADHDRLVLTDEDSVTDLAESFPMGRDLLWDLRVSLCPLHCLAGITAGKAAYDDNAHVMSSNNSMPGSPTTPARAMAECNSRSPVKASACCRRRELVGDEHQVVILSGSETLTHWCIRGGHGWCLRRCTPVSTPCSPIRYGGSGGGRDSAR
jgi:hypothetical protein